MTAVLLGDIPFDWEEATRIAASPSYGCTSELNTMRAEVETELAKR